MLRRTTVYVLAPPVLIGLWALGYFIVLPQVPQGPRPRVDILPAIPVGLVPPEPTPVDPVFKDLLQPMEQARREWMKEMAADRAAMIEQVYELIDAADPEGRPRSAESNDARP